MAVEALTAELTAVRGASRKAPLCSFQKANICPRERWLQSLRFLANFGARRFPKGNEGKRVSSGYNRRRRLATRSSGKQQAERTAVRTAPIVCPEGSPLVRPQAQDFFPAGGLTRRLRRGSRACSPMGRSHFSFVGERKVCKRKPAARRLLRPAPLRVAGFGLREPFGLSSTSVRCAHPPGKRLLLPILTAGLATSRAP